MYRRIFECVSSSVLQAGSIIPGSAKAPTGAISLSRSDFAISCCFRFASFADAHLPFSKEGRLPKARPACADCSRNRFKELMNMRIMMMMTCRLDADRLRSCGLGFRNKLVGLHTHTERRTKEMFE